MKTRIGLSLVALALLLGGCAAPPQNPVELAPTAISSKNAKVGVAMTKLPKVDTHLLGANCLLCIATASAANHKLTAHTQTLPYEDLPSLKTRVAELIRKKGGDVIEIQETLDVESLSRNGVSGTNVAAKDFSPLKKKFGVDKLVVLEINRLGMIRTYASYFPTSDPKATLAGVGYIVNLSNNTYEWYQPIEITKSADKAWDEPTTFPGLTNAYFQALEMGKDGFLKPFN